MAEAKLCEAQDWLQMQGVRAWPLAEQTRITKERCQGLGVEVDRREVVLRHGGDGNTTQAELQVAQAAARIPKEVIDERR